mgnify:CR=1 FL=1
MKRLYYIGLNISITVIVLIIVHLIFKSLILDLISFCVGFSFIMIFTKENSELLKKHIIVILISTIVIFMLNVPWSDSVRGKFQNRRHELEIVPVSESNKLSQGSEIWLHEIEVDGENISLSNYLYNNPSWMLSGNSVYCPVPDIDNNAFTAYLVVNEDLKIILGTHAWSGMCQIYLDGNLINEYDLYSYEASSLEVNLSEYLGERPLAKMYYVFVLGVLGTIYAIIGGIFGVYKSNKIRFSSVCFGMWSIYFLAFYPALMSSDVFDQWSQALGKSQLNSWHPVFHTLCIRFFMLFSKNPAMIVLTQIILMSALMGIIVDYLCRIGLSYKVAWFMCIFTGLFPANGVMLTNLWKDIPYALCMLAVSYKIFVLIRDKERWRKDKSNIVVTFVSLVGVALFRHNGIIPFIAICLMLFCLKEVYLKKLVLFSILAILIIEKAIFPSVNVSNGELSGAAYSFFAHNLGAVYANNGNLDHDDIEFMESIIPLEEWEEYYYPYSHNEYAFSTEMYLTHLSEYSLLDFLSGYLKIAIKNIPLICQDVFSLTSLIWEIPYPEKAYISIANYSQDYTNLNEELLEGQKEIAEDISYQFTPLTKSMIKMIANTETRPWVDFFWRLGWLHLGILFMIAIVIWKKQYKYLCVFIPIVFNVLSLFISMVSQSYRYLYSTVTVIPLLFGMTLIIMKERKS